MNNDIRSDYISLKNFLYALDTEKQPNIDELTDKISTTLTQMQQHASEPIHADFKARIAKVLSQIEDQITKNSTPENKKVQEVRKAILSVQGVMKAAPLAISQKIEKPKIGINIAVFSDFDYWDRNGAIAHQVSRALDQKIPFIASRFMLNGNKLDPFRAKSTGIRLRGQVLSKAKDYDIFQKGELFVFIPKTLLADKKGMEKLKDLDFQYDGTLKEVDAFAIYQPTKEEASVKDFEGLFRPDPQLNKLFFLSGHGSPAHFISSMKEENYLQFSAVLKQQRCMALTAMSCFAGGPSGLIGLPVASSPSDKKEAHPYPVIVRSVGEYMTSSGEESVEGAFSDYFDELQGLLESSQPETTLEMKKVIEKTEGQPTKSLAQLAKVYFPTRDPNSPSGFRPIGEHGLGFSLTYTASRLGEVEGDKKIHVKNKGILEVHPLITRAPLVFEGKNPVLASMLPSETGHHLLSSVTLSSDNPKAFIKTQIDFDKKYGMAASKAYFIGQLISADQKWDNVVLHCFKDQKTICAYKNGNDYFWTNGDITRPITALQHALICLEVESHTRSDSAAIRTVSSEQESEPIFRVKLRKSR